MIFRQAFLEGIAAGEIQTIKAGGDGRWYLSYIGSGGAGGSDFDVFVRASTDAGATFGAPVAVTSNTTFDDKPYLAASGNHLLARERMDPRRRPSRPLGRLDAGMQC